MCVRDECVLGMCVCGISVFVELVCLCVLGMSVY